MNSTEHIANLISHQCSGIVWVTSGPLDLSHPDIYALNYLLDGLLIQRLKEEFSHPSPNGHFFLSENFGKPFFIGHVSESQEVLKSIEGQLKIIAPLLPENAEIYLMNQGSQHSNLLSQLQKKFPAIRFNTI